MRFDFPEDDEDYYIPKYVFGKAIDSSRVASSIRNPQFVNYQYLQIDKTEYNFSQDCFDNKDIIAYFKFVKLLSTKSFDELLSNKNKEWHLNSSLCKGRLAKLINETIGNGKRLDEKCTPTFYHFALYTLDKANRETKVKSPRIYFFLGDNATIYPLFYDPYHEINP